MKRKFFLCLLVLTLICLSINVSSAQTDTVDCSGICTSSSWTYSQHSATVTIDTLTECCVVNYNFKWRTCSDSSTGTSIHEFELLRITPTIDTCDCSIQDIMKAVLTRMLYYAPSLIDTNVTPGYFEAILRTSKCWYVDVSDSNSVVPCDTGCYQTLYGLYYYSEVGIFVVNHQTSGSTGNDLCNEQIGCINVLISHDIEGPLYPGYILPCNDLCSWTIFGNSGTDENNFIGTIYGEPLIVRTHSQERMRITEDGNIGIGVENPLQKLVVNGTICAKEVNISISGEPCWEDYVFDKNYNLKTLDEVENYIKQNKHLPDIPPATEVLSNGIQLGEMQGKLLMKIEELTLYVIQLKKDNESLKSRINKLEKKRKIK